MWDEPIKKRPIGQITHLCIKLKLVNKITTNRGNIWAMPPLKKNFLDDSTLLCESVCVNLYALCGYNQRAEGLRNFSVDYAVQKGELFENEKLK